MTQKSIFAKEEDVATIYKIEKYVYDRLVHYGQAETARAYEVIELYKNLKETLILQMIVY